MVSVSNTITNNGTLTIEDSVGGGVVDNVSHGRAAIYNNGTIAEIKGGKFTRSVDNSTDATSAKGNSWYVVFNAESGSIEKISGGEFLAVGNFFISVPQQRHDRRNQRRHVYAEWIHCVQE